MDVFGETRLDTTIIIDIYVNPSPEISVTVVEDTLCDGGTSTITVSSTASLTSGDILFDYTIEDTSGDLSEISGQTEDSGVDPGSFNQMLDNHTDQVQWVEYRIHPYTSGSGPGAACDYGTDLDTVFRIYVNPTPRIEVSVVEDTICDGGTSTITVTSPVGLTAGEVLFDYTIEDTSGPLTDISGQTTDNGASLGPFNQMLDNHTDQVQWVEYRIHPYAANTGSGVDCDYGTGLDTLFRIYVNPSPEISVTVVEDTLCDGGTSTITVSSTATLTDGEILFDYTIEDTSGPLTDISGQTTDNGVSPGSFNQTLDNHTDQVQWVEYRIHPYTDGTGPGASCDYGTSLDSVFRIYVNPSPRIEVSVIEDTICDGGTSTITVSSTATLTDGEILFDYTIEDTSGPLTDISGQTTDNGVSLGPFNQMLDNHTDQVQWVEYRIHPYAVNTGSGVDCDYGTSLDSVFRIYVNPSPRIEVSVVEDTICDGGTSTITVTSAATLTDGEILFDYTIEDTSGPLTDISGQTTDNGVSLGPFMQTLDNHTDQVQWVEYRIHPYAANTGSGVDCDYGTGLDTLFRIYVNPSPEISVTVVEDTLCDGGTSTITVTSTATLTDGEILFDYTIEDTSGPLTDISGQTEDDSLSPGSFNQTLDNHTDQVQWVEYRIHPYTSGSGPGAACDYGTDLDTVFRIYVNPTPRIEVSVVEDTICDAGTSTITVSSTATLTDGEILFDYTIEDTSGPLTDISGQTTDNGASLGAFTQTLDNHTDQVQWVEYRIHPYAVNTGSGVDCDYGTNLDSVFRIYVNPSPEISVTVVEDTLCDGGTSTITVSSTATLTSGEILFDYTIEDTSGPLTDISGQTTDNGVSPGSFNQTLDNHTDQVQWVEYRIHPYTDGTGPGASCDYGTSLDSVFRIYVNPSPRIEVSVVEDTICDGGTSTITVTSPTGLTSGEILFDYTIEDTSGPLTDISGQTTDNGASLGAFTQTLDNHTDQVQWVEYRIHPYAVNTGSGVDCDYGTNLDSVFRIYVNPAPRIFVDAPDTVLCNDTEVNFSVDHPHLAVGGEWKYELIVEYGNVTGDGIGGTYNTRDPLTDHLFNPDTFAQEVRYHFIPKIQPGSDGADCSNPDTDTTIYVWVNPTPEIQLEAPAAICNDDELIIDVESGNGFIRGDWEYRVEVDYADGKVEGLNMGGYYTAADAFIRDSLTNTDSIPHTVKYIFYPWIVPDDGGDTCFFGITDSVEVMVDPTPAIRVVANDTVICNNEEALIRIHNPHQHILGKWVYNLEVIDPSGMIENEPASQDSITTLELSNNLFNKDTIVHEVIYRFTPVIEPTAGLLCEGGQDTTIVIWVNPTPEIRVSADDNIICDGDDVTFSIRKPNNPIRGNWLYDLEVLPDPGILDARPSENGLGPVNFTETLTNTDTIARKVVYRFIPRIDPDDGGPDCENGKDTTITIWVNPTPQIRVTANPDTLLCNNKYITFFVDNPNRNYRGDWKYELIVDPDPEITIIGSSPGDTVFDDPANFSDLLVNNDNEVHSVRYHFIPSISPDDGGADCGNGRDTTITIWVNPTPDITVSIPDTVFCNNEITDFLIGDGLGNVMGEKKFIVYAHYNTNDVSVYDRGLHPDTLNVGTIVADSLVNLVNETEAISYFFRAIIEDTREGYSRDCKNGTDTTIKIFVQPTPRFTAEIDETILCDSTWINISVTDQMDDIKYADNMYNLETDYNAGALTGIQAEGDYGAGADIEDLLDNLTDTIQDVSYHMMARLYDNRPGHEGEYCNRGTDTTLFVKVNPTPRIEYEYLMGEDTLCFNEGFRLATDSRVYTTHPLYYNLNVENPDNVNGALDPDPADSSFVEIPLYQEGMDPGDSVGTVTYRFHPYISTKKCPGKDTSIIVRVNPEPVMNVTQTDEIVCYDWGYELPMSTSIKGTTGAMSYELRTDWYDPGNVGPIPSDSTYLLNQLDTLNQLDVRNTGDSIEDVTYFFTPVIKNARASGDCRGNPITDSILVEVAPRLEGNAMADTTDFGGWNIRCHGISDGSIQSGAEGGYYRLPPYMYAWYAVDTVSDSREKLEEDDPGLNNLDTGTYFFYVRDVIGCADSAFFTLTQPDTMEIVDTTIVEPQCAGSDYNDGEIHVVLDGGTGDNMGFDYSYDWYGTPYGIYDSRTDPQIVDAIAGGYSIEITDMNGCTYDADLMVTSVTEINISRDRSQYGDYNIRCNGSDDGSIDLTVVGGNEGGGVGGYEIYRIVGLDTLVFGFAGWDGSDYAYSRTGLEAGIYNLIAYDHLNCGSYPTPVELIEPAPISITRVNPKPHYDTVDISCFGADDGNIDIAVSGGHTAEDYADNIFIWEGPDPDLNVTDSIQDDSDLGPGTYKVSVTDYYGCRDSAEFTLIEPAQIILDVDSIRDLNGWNITCNGDQDGFIEVSSSGGILSHSYRWTTDDMDLANDTLQDQHDLGAGEYVLTITDSIQCVRKDTFELEEPPKLGVDPDIPLYSDTTAIDCYGAETGSIFLHPSGGAGDSTSNLYSWSSSDGSGWDPASMNQLGIGAGTYQVVITDTNGCDSAWAFTLNQPGPILIDSLTADSAYCHGTATGSVNLEVSGGIPGYNYQWSNGSTDEDLEDIYAGVYTVTITDRNLCEKTDSVEVYEADRFEVTLAIASDYHGVPISCADSSDGVIATTAEGGVGPYDFQWNTGATTQDLEGVPAGTYRVVVTDIHNCKDSAMVELTEPRQLEATMQAKDPLCYNDSTGQIELLITGGTIETLDDYVVTLNGRPAGPYVYNLPQGDYNVRVEDLNGCYVLDYAELVYPDSLKLSFVTDHAYCKDKPDGELTLYIDGGTFPYEIRWDRDLPDNEQYFNNLLWGEYVATVTDHNNCVTIDTAFVDYTYSSCLVIPNAFSPNGDGINDLWIVEGMELYESVELRIFDRWGTMVYYTKNAADEPWDGSFYGRNLPIDSYHYVINLNNDEPPVTGNVTIVR
ncbi:MAG: gliding motility-associated C-terminal domain-containing protein [Bacteroidota bacterium]